MERSGFTRREMLAGLAAVPLAGTHPAVAAAPEDFATRLARSLYALAPRGGTLSLAGFGVERGEMRARVRLDWSPGRRQRLFRAGAEDPEAAFQAILAEIETYFTALDDPNIT